jgi:hypothetical protein
MTTDYDRCLIPDRLGLLARDNPVYHVLCGERLDSILVISKSELFRELPGRGARLIPHGNFDLAVRTILPAAQFPAAASFHSVTSRSPAAAAALSARATQRATVTNSTTQTGLAALSAGPPIRYDADG